MENSKLIDLIRTFSIEEIKDFEKFLASPYFTNGRDLTAYYKFLIKYYPDFNISKFEILRKFFKKSDLTDSKKDSLIRTYNWELLKLGEEFITIDSIKKNKGAYDDFFITTLLRRQLGKRSEQVYDDMAEFQDSIKMDHYAFINKMFLQNNGVSVKRLNGKRNETLPLFQMQSENLLNFFLHHAEHLLMTINTQNGLFKTNNTSNNILAFLNSIDFEKYFKEREGFDEDLEIQKLAIYSILISIDFSNFEKYIYRLTDSFKKNVSNFGKEGLLHISSSIINLLSRKKEPEYLRLKFDVINYALQNDFYFDNHYKPINTFKFNRAIRVAMDLNEIEWAKKFSETYTVKLLDEHQNNMKIFASALIDFNLGNFESSLKHISQFILFDLPTNLLIKELQIKNFYKLSLINEEYYETLKYFLDAYKKYLKENCKVSDAYYEQGFKFCEGITTLVNYFFSESKRKKSDSIYKLEIYSETTYHKWLCDEINSVLMNSVKVRKKTA